MKKSKKLAALVLAMVMALSLMAVTAAAYGAEKSVMRRLPACPCGEGAVYVKELYYPYQIFSVKCPRLGHGLHVRVVVGSVYWCNGCDNYVSANKTASACMDACTGDPRSTKCYNPNPKTLWGDPGKYTSEAELFAMLKDFSPVM